MARYVSRPRSQGWVEDEHFSPEPGPVPMLTVDDHGYIDTGILDNMGDPIYRAPNPMGFCRDEEWG
jgi:hypothetical protein